MFISVSVRLVVVWLACAATVTLAPFDFGSPPPGREVAFAGFSDGSHQLHPIHVLLNMLLFVPLGVLLQDRKQRRALRLVSILTIAGTIAFVISFGIEWSQRFLPGRDSSLVDVSANTAGALVGVFASRAWGADIGTRVDELRAWMSPMALAGALVSFMVLTLLATGWLQARTRLSSWSLEYPLLIGNEYTGDRPWRGRVFSLEITDATTPLSLVRRFSAGDSLLLSGTPVARFDFAEGPPYRDAAGLVPDLNWTGPAERRSDGSLVITGHPWLQTNQPPLHLVHRLREANAFTLRIRCATDDSAQAGPARIVSNSKNPYLRNFTIGQRGADLVVRVRTPLTGLNGSLLETIVPDVFSTHDPRDIVITYDGARIVAAVSPTEQIVRTELSPGLSAALAFTAWSVERSRQHVYKVGYLGVQFLPPAVLIALFGRTSRDRVMFGLVYLFSLALAMEGTLVLVSGRAFDWGNAFVTASVGAVVLALIGGILFQADLRPSLGPTSGMASPKV